MRTRDMGLGMYCGFQEESRILALIFLYNIY